MGVSAAAHIAGRVCHVAARGDNLVVYNKYTPAGQIWNLLALSHT